MVANLSINTAADDVGRPAVLIVEDELIVRWAIAEALRDAGFKVVEAVTGDEAVSLLQAGLKFDLVFSDVRMPGSVDGLALLAFIKNSHPAVPVVITSGHCEAKLALDGGASQFVRKPYEIAGLIDLIRDALGSRNERS